MNFFVLFIATVLVFSPLFVAGIRKYTGSKAKRALTANLVSFCALFLIATVMGFGGSAAAADVTVEVATASANGIMMGMKYIGAALAVGLSGIGGGIAVAASAAAALGAISENEKAFGKAMIFVGMAEGVALYGLIVALLLLFT